MYGGHRIIVGDSGAALATLPAASVQTCVTSPPYWGLRDYGMPGQLGLEATPEAYTARMVEVFAEVRRVLAGDGTCWVNLGDSYAGNRSYQVPDSKHRDVGNSRGMTVSRRRDDAPCPRSDMLVAGLKAKDLVGIPWRVAFALQADGWYLRSDIIWSKPNPMPESVTDRPTKAHEYLFLLSKSERYVYDAGAIFEPLALASVDRLSQDVEAQAGSTRAHAGGKINGNMKAVGRMPPIGGVKHTGNGHNGTLVGNTPEWPAGRNKRTVWEIPTQPYADAHFATFPEKLVEPCVLAGCPEGGTVLDPFAGSGTTGAVACRLGRNFIGIELNPEYAKMAERRIARALRPATARDENHQPEPAPLFAGATP